MKINEALQQDSFDVNNFYSYFSEKEILDIPFDLMNFLDKENIDENIFTNLHDFLVDLYSTSNIKEKDYKYIDSKFKKLNFCQKLSKYLYSKNLSIAQLTIHVLIDMNKKNNTKFFEEAYENSYYKNNLLLAYQGLQALNIRQSRKIKKYENQLLNEKDILNFMAFFLLDPSEKEISKALNNYCNEDFIKILPSTDYKKFVLNYEIFAINVMGVNKLYFTRNDYIKSTKYFSQIYNNYKVTDFTSFYKNAWLQIQNLK